MKMGDSYAGFSIGDEVVLVNPDEMGDENDALFPGVTGIVRKIGDYEYHIGVEWNVEHSAYTGLHDLNGTIESDKGWYVSEKSIDHLYNDELSSIDISPEDLTKGEWV